MATATVFIDKDNLLEENARKMREILASSFSEARRRLDEREAQLSLRLEEKINEVRIHNKSNNTDREQLKSVLELMQSGLSSNTLKETGNEATKLILGKIDKLEREQLKIQFNWSPQNLYEEIKKMGEVCTLILPPHEQQKQEIHTLLCRPLQDRDFWYLINITWYKQWKRYVGYDNWDMSNAGEEVINPGPIDNTSLLDQGKLRRHLVDEIDYKLVPEEAWRKLLSWYGIVSGRDSMGRQVVKYRKFLNQCKVEVYPLELKICLYPNESDFKIVSLSRSDTVHTLEKFIREVFNIESTKRSRLYNRYMTYIYGLIQDMSLEAHEIGLFDGQCILLEMQNEDGTWPRVIDQASSNLKRTHSRIKNDYL